MDIRQRVFMRWEMSKYSVTLFQYACPEIWSEFSGTDCPLKIYELKEVWNASYDWCKNNGYNFVTVQFISIGPTCIYIIYEITEDVQNE